MIGALKYTLDLATYSEKDLDALPFGIVHLDHNGTILDFNAYEAGLARLSKADVIGKNFFAEVAPCTHVPEFFGRFSAGLAAGNLEESFKFTFPFAHGPREIIVQMVGDAQTRTAWIVIVDASREITLRLEGNRTITLIDLSGSTDFSKPGNA
jgi:photoactive yellow protein